MQPDTAFSGFELREGLLYDYSENAYPTRLHGWTSRYSSSVQESSYFGYVYEGHPTLFVGELEYQLHPGQYFCSHSQVSIVGGTGIIIERLGYRGMHSVGGPVEDWGRLKYIDGCTDSLLIPPVKMGDPCLNALFFPPQTDQTSHTHPSMRVGMVIRGKGECITPSQTYDLQPGMVFIIHEDGAHKFRTVEDHSLVVVAYHPDSDFGPVDEDHPMINRTIVDGVSASQLKDIQTV
ncbi:MAG: cupin domain-containing protein [Bacteroidota bacterium]